MRVPLSRPEALKEWLEEEEKEDRLERGEEFDVKRKKKEGK